MKPKSTSYFKMGSYKAHPSNCRYRGAEHLWNTPSYNNKLKTCDYYRYTFNPNTLRAITPRKGTLPVTEEAMGCESLTYLVNRAFNSLWRGMCLWNMMHVTVQLQLRCLLWTRYLFENIGLAVLLNFGWLGSECAHNLTWICRTFWAKNSDKNWNIFRQNFS